MLLNEFALPSSLYLPLDRPPHSSLTSRIMESKKERKKDYFIVVFSSRMYIMVLAPVMVRLSPRLCNTSQCIDCNKRGLYLVQSIWSRRRRQDLRHGTKETL